MIHKAHLDLHLVVDGLLVVVLEAVKTLAMVAAAVVAPPLKEQIHGLVAVLVVLPVLVLQEQQTSITEELMQPVVAVVLVVKVEHPLEELLGVLVF
jgi:hypothetical protein